MMRRSRHWYWLVLIVPIVLGLWRLQLDVEVLDLLPSDVMAVQGLKMYQQHFANARELIITVEAKSGETAEQAARRIAEVLRQQTNLVARVTWQPPWLERPGQAGELLAYLWFNQSPSNFNQLTNRLDPQAAAKTLASVREQLATSLSPEEIARLSYDPFGLTRLPENISSAAPGFTGGQELFASADGTFRIVFVEARSALPNYRDCAIWLGAIRGKVEDAIPPPAQTATGVNLGFTGRPAFVTEISTGMEHDMTLSVGGTSFIIAVLFWIAHRRWKPMLWLLVLLALILIGTLGLGGLLFGKINVVSMGFAAILLGLAVDYAVIHYQEALAHPGLSVPEIRRAIAPSIFWAAITTIAAFLVLNFGGLPGLAQLGSLVGLGVALAACVMIFAYLPPLFPDRRTPRSRPPDATGALLAAPATLPHVLADPVPRPGRTRLILALTLLVILGCAAVLGYAFPSVDPTANALRPRHSPSYETLDRIQKHLGQEREPLWLIISGATEARVANTLDQVQSVLTRSMSSNLIVSFNLPGALWPRRDFQEANRPIARELAARRQALHAAAETSGFTPSALALTDVMLDTWQAAASTTEVFWPGNQLSQWILGKVASRSPTNFYALGFIYPNTNSPALVSALKSDLPREGVWLSGWGLLGMEVFSIVRQNMWKLLVAMVALVLLSLLLAFRSLPEVLLSIGSLLLSGLCLLSVMGLAGWSWNLLNLMGVPLILGTGVDYGIFTQLALRRYNGDLQMAYRSVGRALLLCGATAVAGFSSLAFSANAGMSSLGQVCAVGIACNMLIAVYLLPVWWDRFGRPRSSWRREGTNGTSTPSSLYRAGFWRLGLWLARILPRKLFASLACSFAAIYWLLARRRRNIVVANLLPVVHENRGTAVKEARALYRQFALKLVDLWRYESGLPINDLLGPASGWEHFVKAKSEYRGVLLLTLHLGNWEFGGPWLTQKGVELHVVTLAEPGKDFTKLRQSSRSRWNIKTVVIGDDSFAFLEIIRRLEAGETVALLIDRPPPGTAIPVSLFGLPFSASKAAAELARATGCALLPAYLPRVGDVYAAHILPAIPYNRAALRDRNARRQLTDNILHAFEPALCQYPDQWFHFVPIWP